MISTKHDLYEYLQEDKNRYNGNCPGFKAWLLNYESWYIYSFTRHLRYVEYYLNTRRKWSLLFLWHFYRYKSLSFKLHFTIYPNTIGPGLRIYHVGGFLHIGPNVKIGKHCTLLPGVVFGNKQEEYDSSMVIVGDNFYAGLDSKFFGNLVIGDNVTVGANAVVTKNIPDNAIVGGVPARIIRYCNLKK